MKAIIYRSYGTPEVLHQEDVPKPVPAADEVLVRVHASAANPMDCHFMTGTWIARPFTGIRKPKPTCPGSDMAGIVEAVGSNVTTFQPGDAVFGAMRSSFAEYGCAAQHRIARKPDALSFEQAAAIPVAGLTALQGLRDKARLERGQRVLINGASGGVGTFAVQIAKAFGAEVTAVCRTDKTDLVRSIGADHVIDYSKEDFTRSGARFDLVFDCAGNRPLSACRRIMLDSSTYLPIGARAAGHILGPLPQLAHLFVSSRFVKQRVVFFIAAVKTDDLTYLATLVEAHKITPVIDRVFSISEAAAAIRHLKNGHPGGKVVLTLPQPPEG